MVAHPVGVPLENHILGGKIAYATSTDPQHPPENILDGSSSTYWSSTGLFPQEVMITLPYPTHIKKITIWSMKVASMNVLLSSQSNPTTKPRDYTNEPTSINQDLEDNDATLNQAVLQITPSLASECTRHLRIHIKKSYANFVTINKILVIGDRVPESSFQGNQENNVQDSQESIEGVAVTVAGIPLRKD